MPQKPLEQQTLSKPIVSAADQTKEAVISKEDKQAATMKANKELNSMIIKEFNDFQMELYQFMKKSYDTQVQVYILFIKVFL